MGTVLLTACILYMVLHFQIIENVLWGWDENFVRTRHVVPGLCERVEMRFESMMEGRRKVCFVILELFEVCTIEY